MSSRGLLVSAAGFEAAARGEFETARARSHEAGVLGTRHHDPDVLALARHGEGHALIRPGRLDEGLALLDEVMVGATMGETNPIVVGIVYCGVIGACHEITPTSTSSSSACAESLIRGRPQPWVIQPMRRPLPD